jgi:GTP cyclohydrolase II
VSELARYGIVVEGRQPLVIPPNEHNRFYLQTKAFKSGHYIDFSGKPHLPEQGETVRVEGMNEGVN